MRLSIVLKLGNVGELVQTCEMMKICWMKAENDLVSLLFSPDDDAVLLMGECHVVFGALLQNIHACSLLFA